MHLSHIFLVIFRISRDLSYLIHRPYTAPTLPLHCPYTAPTPPLHRPYTAPTLLIHRPYTAHTPPIHCSYTVHTPPLHRPYTAQVSLSYLLDDLSLSWSLSRVCLCRLSVMVSVVPAICMLSLCRGLSPSLISHLFQTQISLNRRSRESRSDSLDFLW